MKNEKRETLGSRLGFLLLSAGCAIGLGNVWRFPYITGRYGGAVFLIAYLVFLLLMGLPILVMEFAVGRGAGLNMGRAFHRLEPHYAVRYGGDGEPVYVSTSWHQFGWFSLAGCTLLMMFYIPVAGWMMDYMARAFTGSMFAPEGTEDVAAYVGGLFGGMLASPGEMLAWTLVVSAIGFGVCLGGVRRGVERVTKAMMAGLLLVMVGLAVYSVCLDGGAEGLRFYLKPDLARAREAGLGALVNDAMNQAFFTLSLGIGAMCIFGSYLKKDRTLTSESAIIVGLDTFVALTAGLIIFPACFAHGVRPDAGPGLIFITLPTVFNGMPPLAGRIFGALFFVFMSAAALTTVIAVVENIIAYGMDAWGWSRRKSALLCFAGTTVLTLPCVLGFNAWSKFSVPKIGGVLDVEDFLVSNTLLPIGALVFCLFCCHSSGWGWGNFLAEADTGRGMKFPRFLRFYLTWVLPVILVTILVVGYVQKFR